MAENFIQSITTGNSGEWMDFRDNVGDVKLTLVIPATGTVTIQLSEEAAKTKSEIDDLESFAAGTWHRVVPAGPRFVRVKNTGPVTVKARWGMGVNARGEKYSIVPQGVPSGTTDQFSA